MSKYEYPKYFRIREPIYTEIIISAPQTAKNDKMIVMGVMQIPPINSIEKASGLHSLLPLVK